MRNKLLTVLASLAAGLLCTPALNADSFTLKFDRAKASFSFSSGKVTMEEEHDSYDAHFRTYAGTIRPGETIQLGLTSLEGYGPDEGIGANSTFISVSVVMKGSRYLEDTPASRNADTERGKYASLSTSYTVPEGAEKVSICMSFSSTGGIDWAPMASALTVFIDYDVEQDAAPVPSKEKSSPFGKGKDRHGSDEEGGSDVEVDSDAVNWDGWMDYAIPAAAIAGITGIIAGIRKRRHPKSSGDDDSGDEEPEEDEEEQQPACRYAMRMYKDFGDTLFPGDAPRQVYAQIVRIGAGGEEQPDPALTAKLTVSGDNYLRVSPSASLKAGWKAADVFAPETGTIPQEGIVTFALAGAKGSYTNHVHFQIRAGEIVFGQDNLTIPAEYYKPVRLPFLATGMEADAHVTASIPNGPYEVTVEWNPELRLHEAVITEKISPRKPGEKRPGDLMPGEYQTFSLKVVAQSGAGSPIEGFLEVRRFQMGLALMGVYEIKCFIEEYDPGRHDTKKFAATGGDGKTYVPAETKARIALYDYDEESHKLLEIAPVPTDYRVIALDDTKQDLVDSLAIQCDVYSGTIEERARACRFRCCQKVLDAPSRIKAQVMLKTEHAGRTYYGYADVLLCSQPRRELNASESLHALNEDKHIGEQLLHIQSQIMYLGLYNQLFPLDKYIDTLIDGYDAAYGYDRHSIDTVMEIFNGVLSGERYGANADVRPLTLADEVKLFISCFFDKAKEVEDSMGFFSRLALGAATLGCADVVFTSLEVMRSMKEYVDKGGDSVWGGFCVGAMIVTREYLSEKVMDFGMKKVGEAAKKAGLTKEAMSDAFQEMKSEAGEFLTSLKGKVTKNAISSSKEAMETAGRKANQLMDLVKSQKTSGPMDDALDYGRKKAMQDIEDLRAAVELYHMNPLDPDNLKLKNKMVVQCQKNKQAMYLLQNYADESLDFTRKEFNETLGDFYRIADRNTKKTLSEITGIPADKILVFNASKNQDALLMVKGKKVTIDRDVTYYYLNAKNEKVYFDQNMTTQIYNHQITDAGTGFRSRTAELSNKFAKSIDQTNIEDVLNHPESYGKDIDILLDPEKMKVDLTNPRKVADAVTYKGKEWFRQGDELLKKASLVKDINERLALQADAVSKYMEGLRQSVKQFDNYIRPRDVARNGADASRIQARLATAVETCRKLFKPGTKVDLADVEDALDRLGFTPDTFVEELGETLYSIG